MTQSELRAQLIDALRLIERLQDESARPRTEDGPVAVVGVGCRLPGGVRGPDDYWRLLTGGVDAVGPFPAERADITPWYDPDPDVPGRTYVDRGAFLDDVTRFDAGVFGISPREAVGMDPQQRMVMEVAWEAIEHAGYAPDSLEGSATGVYLGVSTTDYVRLRQQSGDTAEVDAYQLMGEPSFTAGRLSFALGLTGPSQVVDTACSSSLVAVHDACRALRLGECDTALAGGVNAMLSPYSFVLLSKFRALAPDGRCKTFDASADGYGRGEGVGIVVLKRLADAHRDGDTVLAVIRGSAVKHDGRSSGLTVPNPASQQATIRDALGMAGLAPAEIDYVEAHGTGTALGDPIELRALDAVLGGAHRPGPPLLVGSVKTNIGHLEAAAGIAGLLKLVLSVHHRTIPPQLHFHEPNPYLDWTRLRVRVVDETQPWPRRGEVRAGGVSSFGASGTNAHVVVAEAPAAPAADPPTRRRHTDVLTISARSQTALRRLATAYRDHLRTQAGTPVRDLCATSRVGRTRMTHGLAVVGGSTDALADALDNHLAGRRTDVVTPVALAGHRNRRVAWLFTGQGAQYGGMGQDLRGEPAYRKALDDVAALMDPLLDRPLGELLDLADAPDSPIDQTGYTQPCLFAVEYALAQLWLSWGLRPVAVLGHSVGEITAACVAGVLSLPDAVRLVTARGRLMQSLPPGGVMATLVCDGERARRAIAGHEATVAVAALNGPTDTVIAGPAVAVEKITSALLADGVKSRLLRVSHAFHSPLMAPILSRLRAVTEELEHHEPRFRMISNVSGRDWAGQGPEYWVRHAEAPVRFADGIRTLHDSGVTTYLELGPAPVLLGLAARNIDDPGSAWIPSLRRGRDDVAQMASAAGTLHLRGLDLDWGAFDGGHRHRRVPLPTYAWEGDSYWFRAVGPEQAGTPAGRDRAAPGAVERVPGPIPTYRLPDDTDLAGTVAAALLAAEDAWGGVWSTVGSAETVAAAPDGETRTWYLTLEPAGTDGAAFTCHGRSAGEEAAEAPWQVYARGTLHRRCRPAPVSPADGSTIATPTGDATSLLQLIRHAAALGAPPQQTLCGLDGLTWQAGQPVSSVVRTPGTGQVIFRAGDGSIVGGIDRLHYREPSIDVDEAPWRDPDELLFDLQWHPVRLPDDPPEPDDRCWLLLPDRAGIAARLAGELRGRGARCVVLDTPADGTTTAGAVADALDRDPGIGHVVALTGVDAPDVDTADPVDLLAFRDRGELDVVRVVQAAHRRGGDRPVTVHVVTRGAVATGPAQRTHAPAATPLWGLGRVVALEHPELWGGAVDLDPDDPAPPADVAERLAVALLAGTVEDQLALRREDVLAARLVRRPLAYRADPPRVPVRADGSYLITGGFGGIGTAVADWLAEQGAGALVLAGRSPLPDPASWDDPHLDAADRARIDTVRRLRSRGVAVETVTVDVADTGDVARLVDRLATGSPPLRGVVHAAGVSGPQVLRDVDVDHYDRVWRPKVLGGLALHRATVDRPLDFLLGFSSIAATWGSQFLASYSAANAFLDGLAQHRRSRGLAALSVSWGQWALRSKLFGDDVRDFLSATGLRPLAAPQCLRLLGALLAGDDVHRVVCAADWARYKPVLEARAVRPMLALIDAPPPRAAVDGDAPLLRRVRSTDPAQRREVVAAYLRDELAQIMQLDRQVLDGQLQLLELGIDSLMVMELITRIRQDSGVEITSRDFFATDAGRWDEFVLRAVTDQHELDAATTGTG
ncbi:beta-ketoacyl synthase N-terminal-like domain-containing protein [Micromonospora sp. WMMD723]|uniref:beta-ketoacyl synthase N-terminal-like domain-containing protein n=1 Tax=Micromonospora sp. WMMD723 TaxID=3403465 RepID=UPI003CF7060A